MRTAANEKRRKAWAKRAPKYDRSIGFFERRVFGSDHRAWACSHAAGDTLEVAIGTGLNIPLYGPDVRLVGIDLSDEMLEIGRSRARETGREVDLRQGDAHTLEFGDASFDCVVCTYSLCNIPDPNVAVGEMYRVLRPGGKLILVDHIGSPVRVVLWVQKVIEVFTKVLEGEHMTRRPLRYVKAHQFDIIARERCGRAGVVERLVARKQA